MTDTGISKVWIKKFLIIFFSVVVLGLFSVGVFMLITMSNTIVVLNEKLSEQARQVAVDAEKQTPSPKEEHNEEIASLQKKYDIKVALLESYRKKADDVKKPYETNSDFKKVFQEAMKSYDSAKFLYLTHKDLKVKYEELLKKTDVHIADPTVTLAAKISACYYTYADEMSDVLAEAEEIISALKNEFSQEEYQKAVELISGIEEIYY